MYGYLITISIIILLCIFSSRALYKFGVPSLLIFLALGMLMGSEGVGRIQFNDYHTAEYVSSVALAFIMFYGGFGTKWEIAKPVAAKAMLMSSVGTFITAAVAAVFCKLILGLDWLHSLLLGAIVSPTDAASVFSILRSRKLNLKGGLASLLEVESGSNDPFAYLLTIVAIALLNNEGAGVIVWLTVKQLIVGAVIGVVFSFATIFLLKRIKLETTGMYPVLLTAGVVFGFALCELLDCNGFLCVYIIGIMVGNSKISNKVSLFHFFDAVSWLMQIALFFILGLLSVPSQLIHVLIPGTLISLALIFVARPVAAFGVLSWFKTPIRQQIFVSWVGIRGAASIVFAVIALRALHGGVSYDMFHIVFFVGLFSVMIQGSLTPMFAKKLNLVDKSGKNSVLKTFNDYYEETHAHLFEYTLAPGNNWAGKTIMQANIPEEILIVMIKRGNERIRPKGSTVLREGDILVLSGDRLDAFVSVN